MNSDYLRGYRDGYREGQRHAQQQPARRKSAKANRKPVDSPYMTLREAAEYLGCSLRTMHRMFDRGQLDKHWLGTRIRVKRADLDALISRGGAA